MSHGIVGDDILVALLVHQKVGCVLSTPVKPFAISTHIVVDAVVHDGVAGRPVEADAHSGVEGKGVVPDAQPVRPHEHQPIHPLRGGIAPDLASFDVTQIRTRAVPQPLVFLVVVEGEPVNQAFVLDLAVKPRLPVIAEVVVDEGKIERVAGEDTNCVAADARVDDAHVPATFDADGYSAREIGRGIRRDSLQRRTGKIEGDVVAADRNHRRIEGGRRRQEVDSRSYARRPRDLQSRPELDRRCRRCTGRLSLHSGDDSKRQTQRYQAISQMHRPKLLNGEECCSAPEPRSS